MEYEMLSENKILLDSNYGELLIQDVFDCDAPNTSSVAVYSGENHDEYRGEVIGYTVSMIQNILDDEEYAYRCEAMERFFDCMERDCNFY